MQLGERHDAHRGLLGNRLGVQTTSALLVRLLRLGEITVVTIPTAALEAARDLVRVREDVRAEVSLAAR